MTQVNESCGSLEIIYKITLDSATVGFVFLCCFVHNECLTIQRIEICKKIKGNIYRLLSVWTQTDRSQLILEKQLQSNQLIFWYFQAELTDWVSSKHNMGMAFTRTVWNKIRKCSTIFCTYDDYNWDWSLQKISTTCVKPNNLKVLVLRGPRIFHIGEW